MNDNADYKDKVIIRKHGYYINDKELFKHKERIRYKNNVEYHERLRARAKALHRLKATDIPKLRRGRKPKPKGEETYEKSLPKPKGRPKTKGTGNV